MNITNFKASRILAEYGIKRHLFATVNPWLYATMIISLTLLSWILAKSEALKCDPANFAITVLTLGAIILGLQQWRSSRHETSLEKFYDRLELANRRLDDWPAARALVSQFWSDGIKDINEYQKSMYVYVEIDNIEYIIEKYTRGFMEPKDAYRGFTCFQSRCQSKEFRKIAAMQVAIAGYKPLTVQIVKGLCVEAHQECAEQPL